METLEILDDHKQDSINNGLGDLDLDDLDLDNIDLGFDDMETHTLSGSMEDETSGSTIDKDEGERVEHDELIDKLLTGEGLPKDLILDIVEETKDEHREGGIEDLYQGEFKAGEKIEELLEDVGTSTEIKATMTSTENILVIHNYNQFLLLQSRLTNVPVDILANGLQLQSATEENFEDQYMTNTPEDTFASELEMEDYVEEVADENFEPNFEEEPVEESYIVRDGIAFEGPEEIEEETYTDDNDGLYYTEPLEEQEPYEEYPQEEQDNEEPLEDEIYYETTEPLDTEDEFYTEDYNLDIDTPEENNEESIPTEQLPDMEFQEEYTEQYEGQAEEFPVEQIPEPQGGYEQEEPLQVASLDPSKLNLYSSGKVNNSKTYALHELEVSGSYEI